MHIIEETLDFECQYTPLSSRDDRWDDDIWGRLDFAAELGLAEEPAPEVGATIFTLTPERRREAPRLDVSLDAWVHDGYGRRAGQVENISPAGLVLQAFGGAESGELVSVTATGERGPVPIQASVRWVRFSDDSDRPTWRIGLKVIQGARAWAALYDEVRWQSAPARKVG